MRTARRYSVGVSVCAPRAFSARMRVCVHVSALRMCAVVRVSCLHVEARVGVVGLCVPVRGVLSPGGGRVCDRDGVVC